MDELNKFKDTPVKKPNFYESVRVIQHGKGLLNNIEDLAFILNKLDLDFQYLMTGNDIISKDKIITKLDNYDKTIQYLASQISTAKNTKNSQESNGTKEPNFNQLRTYTKLLEILKSFMRTYSSTLVNAQILYNEVRSNLHNTDNYYKVLIKLQTDELQKIFDYIWSKNEICKSFDNKMYSNTKELLNKLSDQNVLTLKTRGNHVVQYYSKDIISKIIGITVYAKKEYEITVDLFIVSLYFMALQKCLLIMDKSIKYDFTQEIDKIKLLLLKISKYYNSELELDGVLTNEYTQYKLFYKTLIDRLLELDLKLVESLNFREKIDIITKNNRKKVNPKICHNLDDISFDVIFESIDNLNNHIKQVNS